MHRRSPPSRGFSLIEVMISLLIIAILVGLLVPALIYARDSARATVCAHNLRQIGGAWQLYINDHDRFPRTNLRWEWNYGGATFRGLDRRAMLASDRPINHYLTDETQFANEQLALLYRCPADRGVNTRGSGRRAPSELPGSATCFEYFGNSYRGNEQLFDAQSGEPRPRGLRMSEVQVSPSRLLLIGDAEWYYATRDPSDSDSKYSAEWHTTARAGNFLALDGSVRFIRFTADEDTLALRPRPELTGD